MRYAFSSFVFYNTKILHEVLGCINFVSSVPIYVYRTWKISPLEVYGWSVLTGIGSRNWHIG